jgi:hypothetical protein
MGWSAPPAPQSWAPGVGPGAADSNRADSHPDDRATTELVETWWTELFGAHGTSNDKLIGAAA